MNVNDNELGMIVCHPSDANKLVEAAGDEISGCLLVWNDMIPGNVIMVKREDFVALLDKGDYYGKEDNDGGVSE